MYRDDSLRDVLIEVQRLILSLPANFLLFDINMDTALIKTMLESQERAYLTAINAVTEQMNLQIQQLESGVSDLVTSLEFTQQELDEMKAQNKVCDEEIKKAKQGGINLSAQADSSYEKIKVLEAKANFQEDYGRRKNVRISGLKERVANETWEQTATSVATLLQNKLGLPGLVVERIQRVGPRRNDKPRTVVAHFSRFSDREGVVRNRTKLRGTNIFVNDDLCPASQAVRNAQLPLLHEAKSSGKIAFFRHTKLIIREKHGNGIAVGV